MNKKILIIQLSIIIIFISLWQILINLNILNGFIFSSPIKIIKTIITLYQEHNLFNNIYITLLEVIISFIISFILSFIISIILYENNTLYKILNPYIVIINSIPKVALGPILIIWCGANTKTIIVMAILINLIVSLTTIYTGFINTNKYHLKLFKSYHTTKLKTLLYLIIPSSKDSIISSLKLNISMSLIGVITGEFLVSKNGLGYLIIYGTQIFNLNIVMTSIILIILLSYILYLPISLIEKKQKN